MEQTKHFRKRDAILHCIQSTDVHPSADWVFEQVRHTCPDISLATVYRNIALFKQQGLISSLGTVSGVERLDGNTVPHVHFICQGCDAVVDLPQIRVPQSLTCEVSTAVGGQVDACLLSFTGHCAQCASCSE